MQSLPSRGAWIEIGPGRCRSPGTEVAPLTGSVDRNMPMARPCIRLTPVAPLTGSVDRNFKPGSPARCQVVAPLTGSVDRNCAVTGRMGTPSVAPLTGSVDRNADRLAGRGHRPGVAPLTGSVDRNRFNHDRAQKDFLSLPSRGAWIEILLLTCVYGRMLSLPSRGAWIEIVYQQVTGKLNHSRSPHGERG